MKLNRILVCLLLAASTSFAETNNLPAFDELYRLLQSNLSTVSKPELDKAAVKGLLAQLQGRVILGANGSESQSNTLAKSTLFDGSLAYFRLESVADDASEKLAAAYSQLRSTNRTVKGLVLDLRFAGGTDYAAATKVADLFLNTRAKLLDWENGSASATEKTNAISIPVAVLVNEKTTGSAEALAAILREMNVGLVLGKTTAGQASVFQKFPLSNGDTVQIATSRVKLGDGKPLTEVKPDIIVDSKLEDERAWLEDPYKVLAKGEAQKGDTAASASGLQPRRRINEAELVRMQREGIDPEEELGGKPARGEPERPMINDPALARALDLLKGLAVMHQSRVH